MRTVEGFVVIARDKETGYESMWGRNNGHSLSEWEALETNNFNLFESHQEAKEIRQKIANRPMFKSARITTAYLKMQIADSWEEAEEQFKDETSLIVIQLTEFDMIFYGRSVVGGLKNGYIPGSMLFSNGYLGFESFQNAKYCGQEVMRQGQSKAIMASFYLKRKRS